MKHENPTLQFLGVIAILAIFFLGIGVLITYLMSYLLAQITWGALLIILLSFGVGVGSYFVLKRLVRICQSYLADREFACLTDVDQFINGQRLELRDHNPNKKFWHKFIDIGYELPHLSDDRTQHQTYERQQIF